MSMIYSELIEDYFLTNINDDLFTDDSHEKQEEEDQLSLSKKMLQLVLTLREFFSLVPMTEFSIDNCPDDAVRSILIEHSLSSTVELVGLQLWRGALLLADFILAHSEVFMNRNVVELAAGTGLTSVIAAIFCKQVTVTDVDRGEKDGVDINQANAN